MATIRARTTINAVVEDIARSCQTTDTDTDNGQACPPPTENYDAYRKDCPNRRRNANRCLNGNRAYDSFSEAWAACATVAQCAYVMKYTNQKYYLRRETDPDRLDITTQMSMKYTCTEAAIPTNYVHWPKACVGGHNLQLYHELSIAQCATKCDERSDCLAFEYGVNWVSNGGYEARDCHLQSSRDRSNCDGAAYNLDLYVK